MLKPNFSRRAIAAVTAGAMLSGLLGSAIVAPAANAALQFPTYSLTVAAPGTQPTGPQFFEGFSNTVNVAGSETAEYALELVGALYNNAGIFGCLQNSDKRVCQNWNVSGTTVASMVSPSTDIYDNFDHDIINNAQAVGSAAGIQEACQTPSAQDPNEPASLTAGNGGVYPYWPYYTYPTPSGTEGANGIPIDLVRASASLADIQNHVTYTVCTDMAQQAVAQDAVVALSFSPGTAGLLPDGTAVHDVAPATLDFTNAGGAGSATDTAWRVFCDTSGPLAITTWDQLYALEGIPNPPSPDQPLVLWGPKNNSGTGATWFTFAGCGTSTGNIISSHTITENDAQQLSQYAAQNTTHNLPVNTTGCNSTTTPACGVGGNSGPTIPAATGNTAGGTAFLTDNCGGTGSTTSGLGTSTYTPANEACVAQEVADSLFPMSYGYYVSHPYTAAVTIPSSAGGGTSPSYIDNSNYQVVGNASTIGGTVVSGPGLGQPTAVSGDPRADNSNAVLTGRDLWMDYLTDHVRASAAAFVNWACDLNDYIAPKGLDLTTGVPIDTEITNALTSWGWNRISCDGGTGVVGGRGSTYTSPITSAIIDPGPPNNE